MPLPSETNYFSVSTARIDEIKALEAELDKCEHGHRAFQKLPHNMQRRALSSNPQRLPIYLREKHKREIGNKIKVSKRPSRKYRRRPSNLLSAYNRRQRDHIWLESHIWHAKRFHMTKKWGYSLPRTTTNKSFRASLRAATDTCLLQDVSYECALEIEGSFRVMLSTLRTMIAEYEVGSLKDRDFLNGSRWIQLYLYHPNKYPFGAIGCTKILCCSKDSQDVCKLWMWVHPSVHHEVLSCFVEAFKLVAVNDDNLSSPPSQAIDVVIQAKLSMERYSERAPKYSSSSINLRVLKDCMVKFRLTGPLSSRAISNTLKPSDVTQKTDPSEEPNESNQGDEPWWIQFYSTSKNVEFLENQLALWQSVCSNSQKPSSRVLSYVARDPRAVLPAKKESVLNNKEILQQNRDYCVQGREIVPHPFFSHSIRDSVSVHLKSNHEINNQRSDLLVPGTPLPLDEKESRIPVLLMERPGSSFASSNLGSGWDVVLPVGIGSQTLVSFVLNGVAVGGLDQDEVLKTEFLLPPNPPFVPDTLAAQKQSEVDKREKRDHFFKRPPMCRLNYIKLGVRFPFTIDWRELVKDGGSPNDDFYVIRNKQILQFLSLKSCPKINKISKVRSDLEQISISDPSSESEQMEDSAITETCKSVTISHLNQSLLYVRLILIGKGNLEEFAIIALPTEHDLSCLSAADSKEIVEPPHEDPNGDARKLLRDNHQKKLRILAKRRKRCRNEVLTQKENPLDHHVTMQAAMTEAVENGLKDCKDALNDVASYSTKIESLWLVDRSSTPFQSGSRKTIGFTTQGGFSVRMGRSGGLGYVATKSILDHMDKLAIVNLQSETADQSTVTVMEGREDHPKQIHVLVRNPSSLVYRWARLVILNVW